MLDSIKNQLTQVKGIITNAEFQKAVILVVVQTATAVAVTMAISATVNGVSKAVTGMIDARNSNDE